MPTFNDIAIFLKSKSQLSKISVVLVIFLSAITGAVLNNYIATYKIKASLIDQGYSIEELAASLKSIKGSVGAKGNDQETTKELVDLIRSISGKAVTSNKTLASSENDVYYASGHASPTLPNSLGILKTLDDTNETMNVYENAEIDETKVVSTLLSGELIFYYAKVGGWYQVEYKPYKLGWVSEKFLQQRQ